MVLIYGDVSLDNLFTHDKWILDKMSEILFTDRYNDYSKEVIRSMLKHLLKVDKLTYKQVILVKNLIPNKKLR